MNTYYISKSYCNSQENQIHTSKLITLKRTYPNSQPIISKSESNESIAESLSSESDVECEATSNSLSYLEAHQYSIFIRETTAECEELPMELVIVNKAIRNNNRKVRCKNCNINVMPIDKKMCRCCTKKQKLISKKNQEISQSKELLKFVVRKDCYNSLITVQKNEKKLLNCGDPLWMYEYEEDDHIEYYSERLVPNDIELYPELLRQHLHNMNISGYLTYGSKHTKFGCMRPKKSNKNTKLKTLLHNHNILSVCKNHSETRSHTSINFSTANLTKGETNVHVKYHIYNKVKHIFDSYVPVNSRGAFIYSLKKSSTVGSDAVKNNKIFHRQLALVDKNNQANRSKPWEQERTSDIQVVINNSIDRNNVENFELAKTYDEMYLDFLISIQHREITPEDYDYLSRLDEMIKRKTVNEAILTSLKCELIKEQSQIDPSDVCGICLENYEFGQTRKQLPCKHKFHGDCIDQWLSNQSTECPLDKIPIDRASLDDESECKPAEDQFEVKNCLNELIDKIEIDLDVKKCIDYLIINLIDS